MSPLQQSATPFSVAAYLNQRLKQRDVAAFEYIYDQYSTPLYSLIISIFHERDEADGILEKVFAVAWKRINEFDDKSTSIFTWMYSIAREQTLLEKRQQEIKDLIRQNRPEGIRNLAGLKELIKELPEPFRSILLLSYFENAGDAEIGRLLNIEIAMVREGRHKALTIVNKLIARKDEIKKPFLISERVIAF